MEGDYMADPKYRKDLDGKIMINSRGEKMLFKDFEEDLPYSENREPLEDVLEKMGATEIIDMLKKAGQWRNKKNP